MEYKIIYSNVYGIWWNSLSEAEQIDLRAIVKMLKTFGIDLGYPYSSKINHSPLKTKHMRELRTKHKGKPYRILYAFDPKQQAVLLLGGDKTGDKRWYVKNVPEADNIYQQYLITLKGGK
ncbi:MAG: hypothetical protein UR30_C0019G0015 [Candidatus Peregrinibacteria bacterium GW2011_GWC2_33_13]|nr:MAG: hypothetical protein UR30_C0019G0015 [Candidatus Peregrinibacteria bacterium GW2011_GWC2_33_13]